MSRKAQIQQVFIYLMAIIVIGFLVLFGFRMINKILDQKCEVEQQSLVSTLMQGIDQSTRYGTVTQVKVSRPCDYQELCVVDKDMFLPGKQLSSSYESTRHLIWANTVDDIQYNVYLVKANGDTTPLFYDERLSTTKSAHDENITCVRSRNGQFSLWMEGRGKNGVYVYNQT